MNRAVYLANNLGVDMGMFYKRRDYSQVIDGHNPIVAHEFLGSSVEGKTVLIIDDMISSGESMLDTCKELKEHKADKVIVCCTFGLFTNGLEKFDEYYHQGYLDYVITTNLNYRTQELLTGAVVSGSRHEQIPGRCHQLLNHDRSISASLLPRRRFRSWSRSIRTADTSISRSLCKVLAHHAEKFNPAINIQKCTVHGSKWKCAMFPKGSGCIFYVSVLFLYVSSPVSSIIHSSSRARP